MNSFSLLKEKNGISLVVLIIIVALVGITAVGLTTFLSQNIALSLAERDRARALYLAEMGVADSFWELKYSEKLYGSSSQPYGQIDAQMVNFVDGTSGTYAVPEPADSILSTGTHKGITRQVKVGIESLPVNYAFFVAGPGDFTFDRNCRVTGNCFVNGSVTVRTPTSIDTSQMNLYLPSGETAVYSRGGPFPSTTKDPVPSLANLDLSYYDNLLSLAASQSSGDSIWNSNRVLGDTVLINGDLTIGNNRKITTAGGPSLVVVNGTIHIGRNVNIADSIQFIAQAGIDCDLRVTVGSTSGRSGNLLFTKRDELNFGNNNAVNGSALSNEAVQINQGAEVNGFVYAGTQTTIEKNTTINGCFWGHRFTDDKIKQGSRIIWNSGYIPSPLPPGVSSIGSSSISFVPNSWQEL